MIKLTVVATLLPRSLYLKLLFKTLTGTAVYKDAAKAPKPKSEFPSSYKRHVDKKDQRCCRPQGHCSNITFKEAQMTKDIISSLLNKSKGCICIYLDIFVLVLLSHPMTIKSLVVLLLRSNLKFLMITKLLEKPCPSDGPLFRKKLILFIYALFILSNLIIIAAIIRILSASPGAAILLRQSLIASRKRR